MRKWQIAQMKEIASEIVLRLPENSPLRSNTEFGHSLSANVDGSIFPHLVRHFEWHMRDLNILMQSADPDAKYHLIDIGAKIGLFSRQILVNFVNVVSASCFEPSPEHVNHLTRNLSGFPNARIHPYGLHRQEAELTFYRDASNSGNYSFNQSAVSGRPHTETKVPVRKISEKLLLEDLDDGSGERRIIWKSDTQGLDEILITELPLTFWSKVDVMTFEGWRVDKPEYDVDKLRHILSGFDFAYEVRGQAAKEVTADSIVEYLSGRDRKWTDFFASRRPVEAVG